MPYSNAQEATSMRPPARWISFAYPIPQLAAIDTDAAIKILTNEKWEDRSIHDRRIQNLRAVIEAWLALAPDTSDYPQILLSGCVIDDANLCMLDIPYELYFDECFFLTGLYFNGSKLKRLRVNRYYIYGNLGLNEIEGDPIISLHEVHIDQVWMYGSHIDYFSVHGGLVSDTLAVAQTDVKRSIEIENTHLAHALWIEKSDIKGSLQIDGAIIDELVQLKEISPESIKIDNAQLHGAMTITDCQTNHLSFTGSNCEAEVDLRNLNFKRLDVTNARIGGRVLLNIEQIRRKRADFFDHLRSKWDLRTTLDGEGGKDIAARRKVAEQLFVLRENFGRIPSLWREEDYCTYRLMEQHRRLHDGMIRSVIGAVWKHTCGYLILPLRLARTILVVILAFALIYTFWPYGSIVQSDAAMTAPRPFFDALYFSVITFTTVGYGDIHPAGSMRLFAMVEGLLGIFLMAVFAVSMARRILRW